MGSEMSRWSGPVEQFRSGLADVVCAEPGIQGRKEQKTEETRRLVAGGESKITPVGAVTDR